MTSPGIASTSGRVTRSSSQLTPPTIEIDVAESSTTCTTASVKEASAVRTSSRKKGPGSASQLNSQQANHLTHPLPIHTSHVAAIEEKKTSHSNANATASEPPVSAATTMSTLSNTWRVVMSNNLGLPFYYNTITKIGQFEYPEELKGHEDVYAVNTGAGSVPAVGMGAAAMGALVSPEESQPFPLHQSDVSLSIDPSTVIENSKAVRFISSKTSSSTSGTDGDRSLKQISQSSNPSINDDDVSDCIPCAGQVQAQQKNSHSPPDTAGTLRSSGLPCKKITPFASVLFSQASQLSQSVSQESTQNLTPHIPQLPYVLMSSQCSSIEESTQLIDTQGMYEERDRSPKQPVAIDTCLQDTLLEDHQDHHDQCTVIDNACHPMEPQKQPQPMPACTSPGITHTLTASAASDASPDVSTTLNEVASVDVDASNPRPSAVSWVCVRCTYINQDIGVVVCDICGADIPPEVRTIVLYLCRILTMGMCIPQCSEYEVSMIVMYVLTSYCCVLGTGGKAEQSALHECSRWTQWDCTHGSKKN